MKYKGALPVPGETTPLIYQGSDIKPRFRVYHQVTNSPKYSPKGRQDWRCSHAKKTIVYPVRTCYGSSLIPGPFRHTKVMRLGTLAAGYKVESITSKNSGIVTVYRVTKVPQAAAP